MHPRNRARTRARERLVRVAEVLVQSVVHDVTGPEVDDLVRPGANRPTVPRRISRAGGTGPALGLPDRDLGARPEVELVENALDVPLRGALADHELVGNRLVGQPPGDESRDLELTLRQVLLRRSGRLRAPRERDIMRRRPAIQLAEEPARPSRAPVVNESLELDGRGGTVDAPQDIDGAQPTHRRR